MLLKGAAMLVVCLLGLSGAPGAGADLVDDLVFGLQAYQRGDYPTALREFKVLAEKGDPRAQTNLGAMYAEGKGAPRDDVEAFHWSMKAARQGHPPAEFNVSGMFRDGRGVVRDLEKSLLWTRRAAYHGHVSAQYNLGLMHEAGMGTEADLRRAVFWYSKAAEQGHQRAARRGAVLRASGVTARPEQNRNAIREAAAKPQPPALASSASPGPATRPEPAPPAAQIKAVGLKPGFKVQVAAFRKTASAQLALAAARRDFSFLPDQLQWAVESASNASTGTWYRLRLGSVGSHGEAAALCMELKRRRPAMACWPVAP